MMIGDRVTGGDGESESFFQETSLIENFQLWRHQPSARHHPPITSWKQRVCVKTLRRCQNQWE